MKARRPLLPIQPDIELMTFGILANIDKPGVQQVTTHVISYLRGKQQEVVVHEELGTWYNLQKGVSRIDVSSMRNSESLARSLDILIALGGDGTMLKAARIAGYCGVPGVAEERHSCASAVWRRLGSEAHVSLRVFRR